MQLTASMVVILLKLQLSVSERDVTGSKPTVAQKLCFSANLKSYATSCGLLTWSVTVLTSD